MSTSTPPSGRSSNSGGAYSGRAAVPGAPVSGPPASGPRPPVSGPPASGPRPPVSGPPVSGGREQPAAGRARVPGPGAATYGSPGAAAHGPSSHGPSSHGASSHGPSGAASYGAPAAASYGAPGGQPPRRGPRPRWGRIALVGAAVLVVVMLGVTSCLYLYGKSLDDDLARTDPFSAIRGDRPAKTANGAVNMLLLGSDSRDPDKPQGDDNGPARTDTIIVMHIPASHDQAYLVSIPRDLYVNVPKTPDGRLGGHRAKINAAYAWGGLPLLVQTVEGFTGVRMDHVVVIDFAGFKEVTDALGGVDLNIERDIKSIHPPYRTFKKGVQHLNGDEALDYVRQRYQFPDGDFARVRHQQEFLKALMDKAVSTGTVTNPAKLNAFLQAATDAMTVDKEFSLVDMALQFRGLRSDKLTFMTSPYTGTDTINGESVVLSDRAKASTLYQAMAEDKLAEWTRANPPSPKPGG